MNTENEDPLNVSSYERFEYRLVYLCPNRYADERLTIGLVAQAARGFEVRLLSSLSALDLMTRIFGEVGVEQFQFAAGELRRMVTRKDSWASLEMPTDLFVFGDVMRAFTQDRTGLLTSVLASASSLMRGGSTRAREVITSSSTTRVSRELYNEVSLLDPLKADDLFHRKVIVKNGDTAQEIELPIFGNRIFGAPVSMSRGASDQKMRAEAYVAKFRWIQQYVPQRPKVYILAPEYRTVAIANRASVCIRELQDVAAASRVDLGISESMPELAACVIRDEAA